MNKPEKKFNCGSISASIRKNTKVVTGEPDETAPDGTAILPGQIFGEE